MPSKHSSRSLHKLIALICTGYSSDAVASKTRGPSTCSIRVIFVFKLHLAIFRAGRGSNIVSGSPQCGHGTSLAPTIFSRTFRLRVSVRSTWRGACVERSLYLINGWVGRRIVRLSLIKLFDRCEPVLWQNCQPSVALRCAATVRRVVQPEFNMCSCGPPLARPHP